MNNDYIQKKTIEIYPDTFKILQKIKELTNLKSQNVDDTIIYVALSKELDILEKTKNEQTN